MQRVRLAGPGTVAGHLGLLEGEVSPVCLRALERSVAIGISRERFSQLLQSNSLQAHAFVTALQEDLVSALADAERREAQVIAHRSYES
jgi:CRP-like cAMP-binding protein